jgi:hypothetical protein
MIALTKAQVSRPFSVCHRNVQLRLLGWLAGSIIAIEYPWSKGHDKRLAEIAAEFVRRKVDVIVTWGTAYPPSRQKGDTGASDRLCGGSLNAANNPTCYSVGGTNM